MTVTLSNTEDNHVDGGQQRAWIDDGSSIATMDVLQPGEDLVVLETGVTVPNAKHVVIQVHSLKKKVAAVFDLYISRFPSSRCYWQGTEWSENTA